MTIPDLSLIIESMYLAMLFKGVILKLVDGWIVQLCNFTNFFFSSCGFLLIVLSNY